MTTIQKKLENIKRKYGHDNELIERVIEDALEQGEDAQSWLEDVQRHGCQSGAVSGLIYHSDTQKFFKRYAVEIGEAFFEYAEDAGVQPQINSNINSFDWFAWFGYEYAVGKVLERLEFYDEQEDGTEE